MAQPQRAPQRRQPYRMRPPDRDLHRLDIADVSNYSKRHPPELRAARTAAVAAICAALISATSGIATYVTSQNQISAEEQRSAVEFLRSERKEAYAQFLADELAVVRALQLYLRMAYGGRDPDG